MNRLHRISLALDTGLAALCVLLAFLTTSLHAQQPSARSRPAARPKPGSAIPSAPAAAPAPTPAALETAPASDNETAPPTDDASTAAKGAETETIIDASESASFNSKDRIATFIGDVRVKDPRFELACDELTVYLARSAVPDAAGGTATPAPANPPAPGAGPSPAPSGGGIDHAVAKGHVIIIQRKAATKPGEEEKLSIGRGGIGTFDNKSGDMVLKEWPSLEQNGSSLVATAPGTVMTIHRDSSLNTDGPCKTKLIQRRSSSGNTGGGIFDFPTGPSSPNKGRGANQPPAPAGTPARGASSSGTQH